MDYDKFDDMYYNIGDMFKIMHRWIGTIELKNKEEVHITTQFVTHLMLFINIQYNNRSLVEQVMKNLIYKNKVKHINSCESQKEIENFLKKMSDEYFNMHILGVK